MTKTLEECGLPAFPSEVSHEHFTYPSTQYIGMTLRDYFAIRVLAAMISGDQNPDRLRSPREEAVTAYLWADALLEVRGE